MNDIDASTTEVLAHAADAILDKKGEDLAILDVRKTSSLTQFFIICSGGNVRQNSTIADEVRDRLKKLDVRPLHSEPGAASNWVLLDFGYIIVHIFLREIREFYDLEGLWGDAQRLQPEELINTIT